MCSSAQCISSRPRPNEVLPNTDALLRKGRRPGDRAAEAGRGGPRPSQIRFCGRVAGPATALRYLPHKRQKMSFADEITNECAY